MIKEVAEHIFRLEIPLPQTPLKRLNSYYIQGRERDFLIDTGFNLPESREGLRACLKELGSKEERRDILITHLHSDHSGLVGEFAGPDSKIYMSQVDLELLGRIVSHTMFQSMDSRYMQEGFPAEQAKEFGKSSPARVTSVQRIDKRFIPLADGDQIQNGNCCLQAIWVPGHTPGNMMFWMKEHGIMFTGDHILFDISPNITAWDGMEDSLGSYLESLKKAKQYPVKLALPGHREPGDYRKRIDEILLHHERRLQLAEDIVRQKPGLNAYEIAGQMKWKLNSESWESAPTYSKWFALGECLSHLDHLRALGRIKRIQEEGSYGYCQM
ncbi:MAG: MBL fold metallo-hydrolase [Lachnospiraceae bacterium]|jgi:glyoxylase-like metal-dependent hydrolase (beta-lactamase superfamily II)|nr:MBL fold metallo-hydrolase [Lachnospiraceae bacterium]